MIKNEKDGVVFYTFKNLAAAGLRHAFSTRRGGTSHGHFAAMNLGLNTGDNVDAIKENYSQFCAATGFDTDSIVISEQKHTTNIHFVDEKPAEADFITKRRLDAIDALATNVADVALVTYCADCVPILFYDPVLRVAANAHAGWRGTADNIAGKTIDAMIAKYGCNPANILVGIGPSISRKNFETDADVADEFKKLLPFSADFIYNSECEDKTKVTQNKFYIDLWMINKQCLAGAGVCADNIEIAGLCTYDEEDLFFSHRRSGVLRGALAMFVAL